LSQQRRGEDGGAALMAGGSGVKTNEREGTRAVAKYIRISPYKVREVLDLIRGQHVQRAAEILRFSERDAAFVVGKVLASAVANAENNDGIDADDLYVSTAYADEGVTLKRFRPRARGRAGRIRKRTCHITIIVSRMPEDQLRRYHAKQQAEAADRRARRVAAGRAGQDGGEGGGRGGRFRRRAPGKAGTPVTAAEATTEEQTGAEDLVDDEVAADVATDTAGAGDTDAESAGIETTDAEETPAAEAESTEAEPAKEEGE
jgi:large subunit ribosomal protein L22